MARLLMVVDYQNDFVSGTLGFKEAEQLEKGITEKINEYAQNSEYVICTMDTHGSNYETTQEGKKLPVAHCLAGTNGWQLYGKVKEAAYHAAASFVEKNTFGAERLISEIHRIDSLERRIDHVGITEVEICGVVTNMCVISNAVIAKAVLPEANIKILSNLCSSFNMEEHQKALDIMADMQMEVI